MVINDFYYHLGGKGIFARKIAQMDVGEHLTIEGRVQSRTYTKLLEGGSEERTAFEVSVMQLVEEREGEDALS